MAFKINMQILNSEFIIKFLNDCIIAFYVNLF